MASIEGHSRVQTLRSLQPMQSQQVPRIAGYSSGDRSFAISATNAQSRLEPPKPAQAFQRHANGNDDRGYGAIAMSRTTQQSDDRGYGAIAMSRGTQPYLRPSGYGNATSGAQQISFPSGINTREHSFASSHTRELCKEGSIQIQPIQRPNAMQERSFSRQEVSRAVPSTQPRQEQPLSRPSGFSIEKRGVLATPTSPKIRQDSFQDRFEASPMTPAWHQSSATSSATSPSKQLRSPLSGPCNPATSRSSWPPVKRPSPGRIEETQAVVKPGIDLDEFLDCTNAVAPEVRPCHGDDDMMGDGLLNTLRSVSSFSKVDAEEMPQRNERVEANTYNAAVYSLAEGAPAKESTCSEYDLDRENSNAAALLLCHTATPKLSLHPRGLRSVAGGPVSFATAAHPGGGGTAKKPGEDAQNISPNPNDTEDVSFTWKLLGAAETVVQFFSSLRPIDEKNKFAAHSMRQTLPNPKRLHPNELFESRQRDQLRQAALSLKDAVTKLIAASGTTEAERATVRMPIEIRSRFTRLRLRLSETLGSQKQRLDPNATGNLERFVSMCNYLAQADPAEVPHDVRQEFISFSQRHAQDLESHCRTLKWLEEDQRSRQIDRQIGRPGGNVSIIRVAGQVR